MTQVWYVLIGAAYTLVAVHVGFVLARTGMGPSSYMLGALWPLVMIVVGVVTPLTGSAGIYEDKL